ncbi:hypothetical protein Purlil1_1163 [Purpureocillium lilacinum]|uniref:Uncharacterized protein n=1 Tax=Purpureocillium lilacinum TaxID=33203 RepID=A0ABR0CDQ5_PURLI|nr:hypothetical protein Purlil1_1163 [Purpureocillium lilacinum]
MLCSQGLVTGAMLYGAAYVLDAASHFTGVHQLAPRQGLAIPRKQRVGAAHTDQSLPTRRIWQGHTDVKAWCELAAAALPYHLSKDPDKGTVASSVCTPRPPSLKSRCLFKRPRVVASDTSSKY